MLWFFWTLQVLLLQRWCLTRHCVHSLTPRGNRERPESRIYLKIFEKNPTIFNQHPVCITWSSVQGPLSDDSGWQLRDRKLSSWLLSVKLWQLTERCSCGSDSSAVVQFVILYKKKDLKNGTLILKILQANWCCIWRTDVRVDKGIYRDGFTRKKKSSTC